MDTFEMFAFLKVIIEFLANFQKIRPKSDVRLIRLSDESYSVLSQTLVL